MVTETTAISSFRVDRKIKTYDPTPRDETSRNKPAKEVTLDVEGKNVSSENQAAARSVGRGWSPSSIERVASSSFHGSSGKSKSKVGDHDIRP